MGNMSIEQAVQMELDTQEVDTINFGLLVMMKARDKLFCDKDGTTKLIDSLIQKFSRNPDSPRLTRNELLLAIEAVAYPVRLGPALSGKDCPNPEDYVQLIKKLSAAL